MTSSVNYHAVSSLGHVWIRIFTEANYKPDRIQILLTFQIETKQNGNVANGMDLKPIRAKALNENEESSTDPRTEWECPRGNIKIIKEIETDGFGKTCKGSVSSQKDDGSGSVMLRILKGTGGEIVVL